MGLNVGSIYAADYKTPKIDIKALNGVAERIFNPDNERTVDVSSLNLSKFNRVSLGTDLYSQRTANEVVLKAAKAVTDYGINFSNAFNTNIQYLNSIAAQSLFTSKENNGKVVISVDNIEKPNENEIALVGAQVTEAKDLSKDKRGSNPFSFYMPAKNKESKDNNENILDSVNIFA